VLPLTEEDDKAVNSYASELPHTQKKKAWELLLTGSPSYPYSTLKNYDLDITVQHKDSQKANLNCNPLE